MPAVCLHFHLHLPTVLKSFAFFDLGKGGPYIDTPASIDTGKRFVTHTLIPAIQVLEDQLIKQEGNFKLAFSVSGTTLDLFQSHIPDGLKALQRLNETGQVEWLNSPYFHSLSWLYDRKEFARQLNLQQKRLKELFGHSPQILFNTHLIYNNYLAYFASLNGYRGILCEGIPRLMTSGTENEVCYPTDTQQIRLLLRNSQLSEDISLRFSESQWEHHPLSPEIYSQWLAHAQGSLVLLSMNFNVFERQADLGILHFFHQFPDTLLKQKGVRFLTPSGALDAFSPKGVYNVLETISWDGPHRDSRTWIENPMQQEALEKIYALSERVQTSSESRDIHTWSVLQSADFFAQMQERAAPGPEFAGSPYARYARYMNILADFQMHLPT